MPEELQIDVAGAEAAMAAANINPLEDGAPPPNRDPFARDDAGRFAAATEAPAPVADGAPEQAQPETSPEGTSEPEPFTHIDDAAILAGSVTPEMMLQFKKTLQADYTKKAMEVADWRKLGETGLSQEDMRNAAELYQRLQDPSNLPQFQQELSQYMQSQGVPGPQADAMAANQTAEIAPAPEWDGLDGAEFEDPQLAQVISLVKQQQAQIERLTGVVSQSQAERDQQAEFDRTARRLTAEEQHIRAANPTYTDEDLTDIYSLMGPEADLKAAQVRFESIVGARLARYLGQKDTAHATTPTPVAGGGVLPVAVETGPVSMDEGHARAMARIAELDALDPQ